MRRKEKQLYYVKNKKKISQVHKEYREQNKEKIKEYGKKYYEENKVNINNKKDKEKIKEYQKKYREKNKEKIAIIKKSYSNKLEVKNKKKAHNYAYVNNQRDTKCKICGSTKKLHFHHTNYEKREGYTLFGLTEDEAEREI